MSVTYFSSKACIFLRAEERGCRGSSRNTAAWASSFFRSQYPNAASRSASAFCSGHSKCFSTALSSTCHRDGISVNQNLTQIFMIRCGEINYVHSNPNIFLIQISKHLEVLFILTDLFNISNAIYTAAFLFMLELK